MPLGKWTTVLPAMQWTLNMAWRASTNTTSLTLMHGWEARTEFGAMFARHGRGVSHGAGGSSGGAVPGAKNCRRSAIEALRCPPV